MKRGALAMLIALRVLTAWAGTPAEDWLAITDLDRGPQGQPRSSEEARTLAAAHLDRQEKALRNFIAVHGQDEHAFEARLRLVRLLDIRGGFLGSEKASAEARLMLDALEKSATPEQRVELDFARVTRQMRGAQKAPAGVREQLLSAARKFQSDHPDDRRVPRLLVEVATLFDAQPRTKIALLNDANAVASDPDLKVRIADDLRRTALLGTPIKLSFTSVQGQAVDVADLLGKPVVIVFFADFSPPSTDALAKVQSALAELPKDSIAALGVDLDPKREALDSILKTSGVNWPIAFDGKSWEGDLVRSLGINSLPTVWLLDKRGQLHTLNALEGFTEQVRQLLKQK